MSGEDEEPILYDPARHARPAPGRPPADPRKTQSSAQQLATLHAGHRRVDAGCSALLAALLVPRFLAPWLGLGWYLLPSGAAAGLLAGFLVGRYGNGEITEWLSGFLVRRPRD